jgi:hypothetical protein
MVNLCTWELDILDNEITKIVTIIQLCLTLTVPHTISNYSLVIVGSTNLDQYSMSYGLQMREGNKIIIYASSV